MELECFPSRPDELDLLVRTSWTEWNDHVRVVTLTERECSSSAFGGTELDVSPHELGKCRFGGEQRPSSPHAFSWFAGLIALVFGRSFA